jgi:hypothetical protein
VFARYLEIVRDLMASEGGELYVGSLLAGGDGDPDDVVRLVDQVAVLDLPADRVAEMFWLNSRAWAEHPRIREAHDPDAIARLGDDLDRRRTEPATATARWHVRQLVIGRTSGTGADPAE